MQVRAVRLERAVLAEAPAGPRERDVAGEGDAAAHGGGPSGRSGRVYAARRMVIARLAQIAAALLAAGCGGTGSDEDRPERPATLVLDFAPNAVHAGIYLATAREFD